MLAHDFVPHPIVVQLLEFIRGNYLDSFPKLVDQNQLNRLTWALRLLVEQLRHYWMVQQSAVYAT